MNTSLIVAKYLGNEIDEVRKQAGINVPESNLQARGFLKNLQTAEIRQVRRVKPS
jgi:hypothetical protein